MSVSADFISDEYVIATEIRTISNVFVYRNLVFVLTLMLGSGFYFLDIQTPLGIADGVLYVLVVAKGFFVKSNTKLMVLTGFSILLIWLGYFNSPNIGVDSYIPLTNRILASFTVLITGFFVGFSLHKEAKLEETLKATEKVNKSLGRAKKRLIDVNEELEAFTYSVSHDLRAPLRAITGFSEELKGELQATIDDEQSHLLGRIIHNANKMGILIDDLLKFSRTSRKVVSFSLVNTNKLIEQIIQDVFPKSNRFISKKEIAVVYGDEKLLEQVFVNLIANAIKYSGKESNPQVDISCEWTEDFTIISISDNGVGFDMNYSDKLFRVFERLHSEEEFNGTGVGLAICKKIMQRHGGDIWGESDGEGKGATFYLKFKNQDI